MTALRTRVFPLGAAAIATALVGLWILDQQPGDLPAVATVRCDDRTADVSFHVELGRVRPALVGWSLGLGRVSKTEIEGPDWKRRFTDVDCPEDAALDVTARDIWGGKTHCWVEVDGRKVAEQRTTARTKCTVRVGLDRG